MIIKKIPFCILLNCLRCQVLIPLHRHYIAKKQLDSIIMHFSIKIYKSRYQTSCLYIRHQADTIVVNPEILTKQRVARFYLLLLLSTPLHQRAASRVQHPKSCGSQQSLPPGGKERLHFVGIRPEVQARKGGW